MNKSPLFFLFFTFLLIANSSYGQCTMTSNSDTVVCANTLFGGLHFTATPSDGSITWTCDNTNIGIQNAGTNDLPIYMLANVTQTEIATIVVTSSLNCADTFQITLIPLPQLTAGSDITICLGDTISLNAASNAPIFWNNNIINAQPFVPQNTDTYVVTAINENNCSVTDTVLVQTNGISISAGPDIYLCNPDTITLFSTNVVSGANNNLFLLPDGSGADYHTSVSIISDHPDAIVTSASDIAKIELAIEHSFIGDLEIELTCPNGTSVSLINAYSATITQPQLIPGGCGGGIGTFLGNDTNIDGGAPGAPFWTYVFSSTQATFGTICSENAQGNTILNTYGFQAMNPNGIYMPDGNFSDFIGCPINGVWTITIRDNQGIDDGIIKNWGLYFNAINYNSVLNWDHNVTNGVPFFNSESTVYTVTATDANGCVGTDQISVFVNTHSDTVLNVVSEYVYFLNGEVYFNSGVYQQHITNIHGCDSTITLNLTITPLDSEDVLENRFDTINVLTEGLTDMEKQASIMMYPNPTNDNLTIVSPVEFIGKEYKLVDQAGKIIEEGKLLGVKNNLSLKLFNKGIYYLEIEYNQPLKVIKN